MYLLLKMWAVLPRKWKEGENIVVDDGRCRTKILCKKSYETLSLVLLFTELPV